MLAPPEEAQGVQDNYNCAAFVRDYRDAERDDPETRGDQEHDNDAERDVDRYLKIAADNDFKITAVADTHIHADYLSGARELMVHHGVTAYLSEEGGPDWQFEWAKGNPNARFLNDGDTFTVGNIELKAVLSAGHTPEHIELPRHRHRRRSDTADGRSKWRLHLRRRRPTSRPD